MNIYLAARFSRRHECHALGQFLQQRGHIIVSRWTLPGADHVVPAGMSAQAADDERRRFAMEDMEDLRACDWCISLMEEPRGNGRGGRHIEFGVALGLGKKLTIIGPRETVFHHLDEAEHFETVDAFRAKHGGDISLHVEFLDALALLREAGGRFREYERHHRAEADKTRNSIAKYDDVVTASRDAKAERNGEVAERIEAFLARDMEARL